MLVRVFVTVKNIVWRKRNPLKARGALVSRPQFFGVPDIVFRLVKTVNLPAHFHIHPGIERIA